MKRFLIFSIFVTLMLLAPTLTKRLTDGFRVAKMRVHFPPHPEWEIPLDPTLLPILDQPFSYLGKGSQCYVFESRDKKYVIKFFRFSAPDSEIKTLNLLHGSWIGYKLAKEETGLLYIHLNPTQSSLPILHCKDRLGRSYKFALDEYRFAIQKRVEPFELAFKKALQNPALMQKRIDQFLDLLKARTAKGIFNADPSLRRNFGFLADKAIEIDFGNYRIASECSKEEEIERYAKKLRSWLNTQAPEWTKYLDGQLAQLHPFDLKGTQENRIEIY